ncbi:MAG: COX15/CtaA family protein [Dokdonella sp.]
MTPSRTWLLRLAAFATLFAFAVIVFGAFVRLSNAGLSCPDWPTCYGKASWPGHEQEIATANAAFPERAYEGHKAWREQGHRMIAGTLGLLVLAISLIAVWSRPRLRWLIGVSALAAALGIGAYMKQAYIVSSLLSVIALVLPFLAAATLDRPSAWKIATISLAVVIFQAMLGMWTVTWLLKPIVVMGHLLGGLLLFSLLGYVAFSLAFARDGRIIQPVALRLKPMLIAGIVLLALQIALGGWTSANYAALSCGMDFPRCLGQWWPATDFSEAFVLWRGIGVNYEGGILDGAARSAIQMSHRIGALVVLLHVGALAVLACRRGLARYGVVIGALLLVQIVLGIGNVVLGLPLANATAHTAVAALLLLSLIAMLARLQRPADH